MTIAEKFGTSATLTVCSTEDMDTIVTSELPGQHREWITAAGLEVIDASAEPNEATRP